MNNWKCFCQSLGHPEFERSTVSAWKQACGSGIESLLRPDGGVVESIPCPEARACRMEVTPLSEETYVASCAYAAHCDPVVLQETELTGYTPCGMRMVTRIALALGLDSDGQQWTDMPLCLGSRQLRPNLAVGVFLIAGWTYRQSEILLRRFIDSVGYAPVLLIPYAGYLSKQSQSFLVSRGVAVFTMLDLLQADEHFNLHMSKSGSAAWNEYWQSQIPQEKDAFVFDTPPHARWEDFRFSIRKNDQTLAVFVRTATGDTQSGSLSCQHLGMAHGRGGDSTILWDILYGMIENQGRFNTRDKQAVEAAKGNIKRLNRQLEKVFSMPDRPIIFDRRENAYRLRCKVEFS